MIKNIIRTTINMILWNKEVKFCIYKIQKNRNTQSDNQNIQPTSRKKHKAIK